MAKTTLIPVAAMRLTVTCNGKTRSKRVTTALQAADFFATMKSNEWWVNKGYLYSDAVPQNRYDRLFKCNDTLRRRSLPIFKKYLP